MSAAAVAQFADGFTGEAFAIGTDDGVAALRIVVVTVKVDIPDD